MKIRKIFSTLTALGIAASSLAVPCLRFRADAAAGQAEYSKIETVDSGVIQPATTAFEIRSRDDLSEMRKSGINVVLAAIDAELNVLSADGAVCDIDEFLNGMRSGCLPAFEIADEETLNALVGYLDGHGLSDVFIAAKNAELLYKARRKIPLSYGILDLRGEKDLSVHDIVKRAAEGFSKIVILDAEPLTVEFTDSLRKRYLSVWGADVSATAKSAVKTILKGVNGVLTDSVQVYSDVYSGFFKKGNSLVRKPFLIGHRGSGATEGGYSVYGPENTLESAQKAYFDGADYVEIDVHFTLDKELVVMHDSALGTLMNAKGTVESTSLAELKTYTYKNFDDSYRIATLKEYIEYFQGTDCMLVIELKDYTQGLAEAVAQMIRDYRFEDKCVVICFSKQSLNFMYNAFPEVSCGALASTDYRVYEKVYDEKHGVYKNGQLLLGETLHAVFEEQKNFNCVYNPAYTVLTAEMTKQLQMRGLGVHLWTLVNMSMIDQYRMQGNASLTIDGVSMLAETVKEIYTEKTAYTANVGETADVKVFGKYHARSDYEGNPVQALNLTQETFAEPVIIDGDSFEITSENTLKAVKEGETTAAYRYKMFSSAGEYYLWSQPFTLTARESEPSEAGSGGCGSALNPIGITGAGFALFGGVALWKKKEKVL